jgi:hypothetical protein
MELIRNIRLRRLQWVGHVVRMKDEIVPKKTLKGCIELRIPVGSSRGRCLDKVDREAEGVLNCRSRRKSAEGRDVWRQRIEESKAQVVL